MKTTFRHALSIMLEFIFRIDDKQISVNGKSFRIYSALRWELMSFFLRTHGAVTTTETEDPMALAELMCSKLVTDPAKEIIHDEEDEALLRIPAEVC